MVDVKVEVKTEDDAEAATGGQQYVQEEEQQREQDNTWQAGQVKAESDKGGQHSRKRPYEESRSYSYYEHREDKRYAYNLIFCIFICGLLYFTRTFAHTAIFLALSSPGVGLTLLVTLSYMLLDCCLTVPKLCNLYSVCLVYLCIFYISYFLFGLIF